MTTVIPKEKAELLSNLKISCDALLDKKGEDLKLLYFGAKSTLTDCFIIATGNSNPHIKALRDNVEKTLKENKVELFSKDRFQPSGWLVIDAIDFVVHIFSQEQRDNYAIEQLWKDADEILFEDL
ncbi:ribosome silencing factor [Opitutales bacterium]|jgi:ribosome-associated protein|uniref:ribosome silencing factor n=1 Tax=Candidatus Seribacter sulfatis TaxID=3381756 RepID=UPI00230BE372|nr:ribosome silencing factor [Opitutales bacterium]|tara:strand:- start:250 stop:624 length:375 start_codon:yes stop_codon:yes gene_type:complete